MASTSSKWMKVSKESWKLSMKLPSPCSCRAARDCIRLLNAHIIAICKARNQHPVRVIDAVPVERSYGCVLPCGWRTRIVVPPSLCRIWSRSVMGSSILKYLKNLSIPLTPTNRQMSEHYNKELRCFPDDCFDFWWSFCGDQLVVEVIVSTCCPCLLQRYINHFMV